MAHQSTNRVVIADDDALVRHALVSLIGTIPEIEIVGEAFDGASAYAILDQTDATTLLMDVRMPNVNGIAALPRIRARFPNLRIVMMTAYGADRLIAHAMQAGADSVIRKAATRLELVDAVMGWTTNHFLDGGAKFPKSGLGAQASPREQEVGRRVATGHTNEQIADDLQLSVNTVKTYVSRLFVKHGVSNRVQLANLLNGMPVQRDLVKSNGAEL